MSTLCRDRKSSTDVYNSQGSLLWSWPHLAFNCSLTSSWPLPVLFLLSSTMDVVLESLSRVWLLVLSQTAAHQASLSFTISWSLLKLTSTEAVMPSNYLILCHHVLLLPSIFKAGKPCLTAQLSGTKYIHIVVQLSPPSISWVFHLSKLKLCLN